MQEKIRYELSAHSIAVMAARQIQLEWMERVLSKPERTEPDKVDPDLQHALGRIAEVTVYFDRAMRGKL